ncbi:MAG: WhiB family transcriptional regulator [Egibacteraceae bacterium]
MTLCTPDPCAWVLFPDDRPKWQTHAACLDEDPALFFPIGTTGAALEQVERAKAVCRRCEVCAQCLDWALETNQDAGVWGETSEDERRSLRRKLQRQRRSSG